MSDSDSVDESKIPSREECENRCQKFAEITGTDSALAMFYLQDRDWELDKSVNAYFEETGENIGSAPLKKKIKIDGLSFSGSPKSNHSSSSTSPVIKTEWNPDINDPQPNRIKLMSWNIDGLCEKAKVKRTQTVCDIINKENPHAVFLQEVVSETLEVLTTKCPTYHIIEAANQEYFTAVMLKVGVAEMKESTIIPFTSSLMLRTLQKIECTIKGRKQQLKIALQHMVSAKSDQTVIFGGDLNLRDKELQELKGLPEGVFDMWQVTGSRKEAEFTWDMMRNTNLEWAGRFKPRCRFDRIYTRHCKPKSVIVPKYFELVGLEKIPSCGLFPSDHWGLLAHFDKMEK
ncbi:tyrosyl-DNA phosphodiesterase 2 [Mytilus galloprovincialis]|uniref:Tyrosyl-DNA phosphodiesterase 2 n=1 Tax=Mytilus galloprovincialis TaxID=29158 RepID=A0A8B6EKQ7_MYTGA|nr:tyrosyl-DNA phosphodiesterase 2 [Mytilus galloprovincialis]